ncbi:hypothetical protein LPJ53_001162 [Coemansia erecta]|uniref:Uncharacterized protein n=1 Tax=Coemansia erecta TaxID=147472 RepID=A0A9W8CV69_9FUNG|nr:hypothetical protein LPJ53_001162 [Coemansia erecta]
MLASPAIADAHLPICALRRLVVAIPAVAHSRHASVLAHHTVHANTRLPRLSSLTAQQTTPVHHGYPLHMPHNTPSFIDPLQYILKDVIKPPVAPLNIQTRPAARDRASQSAARRSAGKSAFKALKWQQAAAVLGGGGVASDTGSRSGAGRTIELDVTPDQLRSLLMMRMNSKPAASPGSPAASAHSASLLCRHSVRNSAGPSSAAAKVAAAAGGKSEACSAGMEPHPCHHASTCAVDFTWSHEAPENPRAGPGSNTLASAAAAATALMGISALLGLESSGIAGFSGISSTDVSNILCCSQL